MALTALSASLRSMMQEILISLVEIILMLMLLFDSASNILEATPLWLCIPAPTMETLAQVSSQVTSWNLPLSFSTRSAVSASPSEQVKEISFLPSRPVDCRMMSTLMFF